MIGAGRNGGGAGDPVTSAASSASAINLIKFAKWRVIYRKKKRKKTVAGILSVGPSSRSLPSFTEFYRVLPSFGRGGWVVFFFGFRFCSHARPVAEKKAPKTKHGRRRRVGTADDDDVHVDDDDDEPVDEIPSRRPIKNDTPTLNHRRRRRKKRVSIDSDCCFFLFGFFVFGFLCLFFFAAIVLT